MGPHYMHIKITRISIFCFLARLLAHLPTCLLACLLICLLAHLLACSLVCSLRQVIRHAWHRTRELLASTTPLFGEQDIICASFIRRPSATACCCLQLDKSFLPPPFIYRIIHDKEKEDDFPPSTWHSPASLRCALGGQTAVALIWRRAGRVFYRTTKIRNSSVLPYVSDLGSTSKSTDYK